MPFVLAAFAMPLAAMMRKRRKDAAPRQDPMAKVGANVAPRDSHSASRPNK